MTLPVGERRRNVRAVIMDAFADTYAEGLRDRFPTVEFRTGDTAQGVLGQLADAEILMAFDPSITREMIAEAQALEWVQALTTGVDNLLAMPELRPEVLLTTLRGIHGPQMAELAFLYMLAFARDWRGQQANQAARVWRRTPQPLLWKRTLVIVGVGAIGEAVARRAKAFEMEVVGVDLQPRPVPGVDRVYGAGDLAKALGEGDFVVVLTPYGPDTHHLIDAKALMAMRPQAYLINLARGGVVDEQALISALDRGAIAGAGLDVFAAEPLATDSRLWGHPRVLLTPHIGGMSDVYQAQALPIIEANLDAFLAGRPERMNNLVERRRSKSGGTQAP